MKRLIFCLALCLLPFGAIAQHVSIGNIPDAGSAATNSASAFAPASAATTAATALAMATTNAATIASVPPNYQSFTPTNGSTVSVAASPANDIFVQMTPSGTLLTLTVNLPAGHHVGQYMHLTSTQAISTLTFTASSGAVLGGVANWLVNGYNNFYWDGTNWRRNG